MTSPVLMQSQSIDREMESLSRNSSFTRPEPMDLSRRLRRSPTIDLLEQEQLSKTKTNSLVSLIAASMKVASLPRVSIGSFFEKHVAATNTDEVQKEVLHQPEKDFALNRDSAPHDGGYDLLDLDKHQGQEEEHSEEAEDEAPVATEESNIDNTDCNNNEDAEHVPEDDESVELNIENEEQDAVEPEMEEQNVTEEDKVELNTESEELITETEEQDVTEENNEEQNIAIEEVAEEEPDVEMDDTEGQNIEAESEGFKIEKVQSENAPAEEDQNEVEDTSEDVEAQGENEVEMTEDPTTYRGPPPIEVAISFDTTGSMSSLLEPLRDNITNVCERLFADVPNLRISIIAHGDYCDEDEFYLMKAVDFTQDFSALRTFLNETEGTGGGDFAECYEYVLNKVGQLSWTPGTQRVLIMIGDAVPHEMGNPDNKLGLDWRQEVGKLYNQMGIRVYSVQCKEEEGAKNFWQELAKRASGRYLQLNEFDNVVQLIMAICYREKDPMMFGAFEQEVRHHVGGGMNVDLHNMFEALRDGPSAPGYYPDDGATPGPSTAPVSRANKRKRKADDSDVAPSAKKVCKSPIKKVSPTTTYKKKVATAKNIVNKTKPASVVKSNKRTLRHEKGRLVTGRIARERVPETRFLLGNQAWSPWKLAVSDEQVDPSWKPCKDGRSGYRSPNLFRKDNRCRAIYEFAVQPATSRKRYPVYLRATNGFRNSLQCINYFFKHKTILDLVEEAMQQNYKVFVRRLVMKHPIKVELKKIVTVTEVRVLSKMLFTTYDYAWNINRYASSGARPLKF